MFVDMGIIIKKDGILEIDDKKFDKVLKDKFELVFVLFIGDIGLMKCFDDKFMFYIQIGGVFQQCLDGLQDIIKLVDIQCEVFNCWVEQLQDCLFKQFIVMDQLIGQFNQISGCMVQVFSSLFGFVKKS